MLCFSLLLFVSNGVSAFEDNQPPGIEMQYDMPEGVSIDINFEESEAWIVGCKISLSIEKETEVKRGGLYALRLWRDDSELIINSPSFSDNSLYAFNHLLYSATISKNFSQWTKSVNKHGIAGIETGYEQVSRLGLYV